MRWFFALLLLMGVATAQSPQPSLSINPPATQPTQPSASDKRGTDELPLTVKVLPAQDIKEKAEHEQQEQREKAEADRQLTFETRRIADYTFWLGIFTLALFCVAVLQAGLFVWQLLYMRRG